MTYADILIFGIVAVSMLVGFFRGFFPELVGVLTWIAAILGGWHFSYLVEPYVAGKLGSVVAELWSSRIIVFVVILIVGGLVGQLVSLLVDKAGLSGTDKVLGLVFGFVRGVIVVGVLVMLGQFIGLSEDKWWSDSALIPYGAGAAGVIRSALPESLTEHLEPGEGAPPDADEAAGDERL